MRRSRPSCAPCGARASRTALIVALVSEMIGATQGLGYFVLQAQRGLRIRDMYAAIVMLALLGFALNGLFVLAESRVLAWHRASTGQE